MVQREIWQRGMLFNEPSKLDFATRPWLCGGGEKVKGATVLDIKPGYYREPVVTCDYSSLYPSIIISRNLCPSKLLLDRVEPELLLAAATHELGAAADAQQAVIRSNHIELNGRVMPPNFSPLAAAAREVLCRSEVPLAGEGEAAVEIDAMGCIALAGEAEGVLPLATPPALAAATRVFRVEERDADLVHHHHVIQRDQGGVGVIPAIAETLLSERKAAKREMKSHAPNTAMYALLDAKQQALKVI
eukprot:6732751-Prymnesium_polylepis.1